MRQIVGSILVASAALAAAPMALAGNGNIFVQGAAGRSTFNYDKGPFRNDHDTSYELTGGYRWKVAERVALGLEGGFTDLGKASDRQSFYAGTNAPYWTETLKAKSLMLGANLKWNMASAIYLTARGGMTTTKLGYRAVTVWPASDGETNVWRANERFSSWYAGVGVGYDITPAFGVALRHDVFGLDRSRNTRWSSTASKTSLVVEHRF